MGAASGAREGAVTGRGAGPSVPGPPSSTGRGSVPRGGGPGGRVGTLPWRGAAGAHLAEVGGEGGGGRARGEERDRAGHRAGGLRAAGGGEPEEDGEGGHGEGGGRRRAGKTKQLPIQVALGPGTAPRRFGGRGGRLGATGRWRGGDADAPGGHRHDWQLSRGRGRVDIQRFTRPRERARLEQKPTAQEGGQVTWPRRPCTSSSRVLRRPEQARAPPDGVRLARPGGQATPPPQPPG